MKLTLNIPDAAFARVAAAICARYGYAGGDTIVEKAQFVKDTAGNWLRSVVIDYEQEIAVNAAKNNTKDNVEANVLIT